MVLTKRLLTIFLSIILITSTITVTVFADQPEHTINQSQWAYWVDLDGLDNEDCGLCIDCICVTFWWGVFELQGETQDCIEFEGCVCQIQMLLIQTEKIQMLFIYTNMGNFNPRTGRFYQSRPALGY